MRTQSGLTLLETIVAIAICAIVLGVLATVATSSLRESRQGNFKVQATQVMDTLGRRVAGGEDSTVLLASGAQLALSGDEVDDLMGIAAFREGAFEATIQNLGTFVVGSTTLFRYRVEVCYNASTAEDRCVEGFTLSRQE